MRETGVEGYALDGYEQGCAIPFRLSAHRLEIPVGEQEECLSVARLPPCVQNREVGSLAFVFRVAATPDDTRRLLERFARVLESIWSLFDTPERVIDLATQISRRQAELADLKIAERALGFLNHPEPGAPETMAQHVESVLRVRLVRNHTGSVCRRPRGPARRAHNYRQSHGLAASHARH
jgi:hypothetical protein